MQSSEIKQNLSAFIEKKINKNIFVLLDKIFQSYYRAFNRSYI